MKIEFRSFCNEDAPAMINCIREEYGDSYFRKSFYNENELIREHLSGNVKFFIAENGKEFVGILAFEILPDENICELICGIILKKYRGHHISRSFFDYVIGKIKKMPVNAICCYPVLYHDIVQKLLERLNFTVCGFIFSEFLSANSSNYYKDRSNIKKHYGLVFHRLNKNNVSTIYLDNKLNEIANNIYSSLNVEYTICNEPEKLSGKSEILASNEITQQHCNIEIISSGEDLVTKINEIHAKTKAKFQTFNIFLNVNDGKSIEAYKELIKLGYFFTGFKPLCNENEFMILHRTENISINFNSFVLSGNFIGLRDYVKKCYERRQHQ